MHLTILIESRCVLTHLYDWHVDVCDSLLADESVNDDFSLATFTTEIQKLRWKVKSKINMANFAVLHVNAVPTNRNIV